jgi:hypothetical protein
MANKSSPFSVMLPTGWVLKIDVQPPEVEPDFSDYNHG